MNDIKVHQTELKSDQALLVNLINDCLEQAKKIGATGAQVSASKNKGLIVNVRMGEVDTVEFTRDNSLDITIYLGQRSGVASTSELSNGAVRDALNAALEIAKATAEDPYAGLADETLMAYGYPDLDLCVPWPIETEAAISRAKRCEQIGRESDPRIVNSDGASISTNCGVYAYGNSHGFVGSYPWSRHSLSCTLVGKDEKGMMQRDGDYTTHRDPTKLMPEKDIAKSAAGRTIARLGARTVKTAQVPVIFAAEIASGFLSNFILAISGSQLYRRRSFLLDSLQQEIFPQRFQVVEDPLISGGLASAPFDAEGVRTERREIVRDGKLRSYVLGSYSARKLGLKTTGNAGGIHNVIFKHDDLSLKELMSEMKKGLIITDVMGSGINLTTGDYSQGANGFWVENGEIQFPVEGVTVAGNLRDLFKNIRAIGNDVDHRNKILTGSLLIDGMMVAGE